MLAPRSSVLTPSAMLLRRRRNLVAQAWSPLSLFAAGEQGGWYDASDVDRYMDVSQSPELIASPLAINASPWETLGSLSTVVADGFTNTSGAGAGRRSATLLTTGRTYRFSLSFTKSDASTLVSVSLDSSTGVIAAQSTAASGTLTGTAVAAGHFYIRLGGNASLTITAFSVREVPDISTATMFQDNAGITPVTAVEQPVGLWLDKRLGALSALSPNRVTNGEFATDTWWTKGAGWTISGGRAVAATSGATALVSGPMTITAGRLYRVRFTATISGGNVSCFLGGSAALSNFTAGPKDFFAVAGGSNDRISFDALNAFSGTIDNVSVQEVPGNHLIQPTSASRPTYSKRYNLLLASENLASASWAKTGSTAGASLITEDSTTGTHAVQQAVTAPSGTPVTFAVRAKAAGRNWIRVTLNTASGANGSAYFNIATGQVGTIGGGSASIVSLGNDEWLCVVSGTLTTANPSCSILLANADGGQSYPGNGSSGVIVTATDFRRTIHAQMGMPAYQRVTTATDYDEAGFLPRLRFDGADDSMYSAASIDFSATDEMTAVAGLTTLGGNGIVAETSIDAAANNGAVVLYDNTVNARFDWWSRGTVLSQTNAARTAPVTRVITGLAKIAADQLLVRSDAVQVGSSTSDQGTGTYGNHLLYVGRRANSSLPFNGDIFQFILRGALTSGADITSAERFVAARTGVTLS